MKNRLAVFFSLIFFCSTVQSSTVQFEKSLYITQKPGWWRSIVEFFFGEEKTDVTPFAIALLPENKICLTDSINSKIHIIDQNGYLLKTVASVEGIPLGSPVAISVDEKGHIFVSDSMRNGIIEFDAKLNFIRLIIPFSAGRITGISSTPKGFYCVNTELHYIVKFDKQFKELFKIGGRGGNQGEFNYPTQLATDDSFVYVVDALNFRIQIFDHNGKYINSFGGSGEGGGNFSKPKGIASDKNKRIFVSDVMFDNIQIFSPQGEFLYYFGSAGQSASNFWMPSGIAIDDGMNLYITDSFNKRVQKYKVVDE